MPIGAQTSGIADATVTVVCLDALEQGDMSGHIYNRYAQEIPHFHGIVELASRMERVFDAVKFPQRALEPRHFQHAPTPKKAAANREGRIQMQNINLEAQQGQKATFIVQVQFRQNATWQGTVNWAETKKTQHFRSMLELIRLMDEALEETGGEPLARWKPFQSEKEEQK
ncbi:MAG: hypothetical protein RR135_00150 [Oscillospiraceae bacterium]